MAELADAADLKSAGVKPVPVQARLSAVFISRGGAVVARRAHNPEAVGSNPSPATAIRLRVYLYGKVAQLVRARGSYPRGRRFKSNPCY